MRNECIIERHIEKPEPVFDAQKTMAKVTGQSVPEQRTTHYYSNFETGAEYCFILGSFAAPTPDHKGFGVVVALDRFVDPGTNMRMIRLLEEFEVGPNQVTEAVKQMKVLTLKYGVHPEILYSGWYSDLDHLEISIIQEAINANMVGDDYKRFLAKCSAYYHPDQTANPDFVKYLRTLGAHGKRLVSEKCEILKSRLNIQSGLLTLKPSDQPAITALAYGVAALMICKPWRNIGKRCNHYVQIELN